MHAQIPTNREFVMASAVHIWKKLWYIGTQIWSISSIGERVAQRTLEIYKKSSQLGCPPLCKF